MRILIVLLFLAFLSCKSAQEIPFERNSAGVYLAQKSSVPLGAVRLTVSVESEITQADGRYFAQAKVIKIHSYGGSFATTKPKVGELVRLYISADSEGRSFKKEDQILLDALTPVLKEGDLLDLIML